ncbi:MAG: DUF4838 domain-containing protein [Planctomycetota bacterium]|nr:DUF4838 domain-containing protein [Planctomycetota bacterium]
MAQSHLMISFAVSCILLSVSAEEQAEPLLKNGGFEADKPGEITIGKMPTGWTKPYASRVLQIVSETRPGSKGRQCMKIASSEKVRSGGAYSDLVPLDPKQGLYVAGWLKAGHPEKKLLGVYFGVGWYDRSRRPIVIQKKTTVNYLYLYNKVQKGDWYRCHVSLPPAKEKKEEYKYEIPHNAAFFDVRVFTLNYGAPAWFDDIEARVMTKKEVDELHAEKEKERRQAARRKIRLGIKPALPTDLNAEWLVAGKGTKKIKEVTDELARYISKVNGKKVSSVAWQPNKGKNVFLVTEVANAPKDIAAQLEGKRGDAFAIRYPVEVDGQKVCLLVAQDEDGYDRPVYFFLNRFMNVHWVGPGELGEVITPQPDWKMPEKIDVLENPDFEMRHWYSPTFRCRQWLAAGVRMSFHHALGHVFHPNKHKDTPEVFPLVGGKRFIPVIKPGQHALGGWQPCTGNPKSIEIATDFVLESFKKNPRLATVSLSVNDGAGNICECELCRAQDNKGAFNTGGRPDLSDRFFRFYNAVMERALEKNPDARIAVLGYGAVKTPPKEIKVHPRISVFHVQPSPEHLAAWEKSGANPNLYMWLWDGGFLTIRPDIYTLTELVRQAQKVGGIGLYSECIPHWIISAPKFYVLAHVLWDTSRDPSKLLDRYLQLAYGEGATHTRAFIDRWYEIYRRRKPEELYQTSWGWRGPEQFEFLRRDDFIFMDAALKKASEAKLTEKQRKRLEYLDTYYQIMRVNGMEFLASQELSNEKWLVESDDAAILTTAEHTTSLTSRFNELYKTHVLEDESGWMIDTKYFHRKRGSFYDRFVGQLRNTVSSNAASATDSAIDFLVRRMLEEKPKEKVIAWLESQIVKRPSLESYLGPQINKLKGVTHKNIVTNGSFEEGQPGDPPKLPGWDFYQFYGMVKNVTAKHQWKKGAGHDGGTAIAMGEGRYPEMKAIIDMEADRRYQLSFWYKSENRDRQSSFSIFAYEGDINSPKEITREKISRFMVIRLDPTDGEWKQFKKALKPTKSGKYILQLAVYYQKDGWWGWFDDIEIRRMW